MQYCRPRHKVIGFVDAATISGGQHPFHTVRHKVIGFVDAATGRSALNKWMMLPPQGHWLRGCRDEPRRRPRRYNSAATRSLASWMPRQKGRRQDGGDRSPPQGHWLRGCRDFGYTEKSPIQGVSATRSLASWMPRLPWQLPWLWLCLPATRSLASWMPRRCPAGYGPIQPAATRSLASWMPRPQKQPAGRSRVRPATRPLASWMPRRLQLSGGCFMSRRHKVIGFVDAATFRV